MNYLTVSLIDLTHAEVTTQPNDDGGIITVIRVNRCINMHLEGNDPAGHANQLRRLAGTLLSAAAKIEGAADVALILGGAEVPS